MRSLERERRSVLQVLQMLRFLKEFDFHITPWEVRDRVIVWPFQSGEEANSKTLSPGVALTLFSRSISILLTGHVSKLSFSCLSSALICSSVQILFLKVCLINLCVIK